MILALTSAIFIIPAIITLYNRQWLASSACIAILFTSVVHHSTIIPSTWLADQLACFYFAAVSLYYAVQYKLLYVVIPFTLYTIFVYHYGYLTKSMTWCEDPAEQIMWHSSIHVFIALSAAYGSYKIGKL